MGWKVKLKWAVFIMCSLTTLVLFNNCQPAIPVGEADGSSKGTPPSGGPRAAQNYFTGTVLPIFQNKNKCAQCHGAQPRDNPPFLGPNSIFDYAGMKAKVATDVAATADNNYILNKMKGSPYHGAVGINYDACVGDVLGSVSPCKEVKTWLTMEFPYLTGGLVGAVTNVSLFGVVTGYAVEGNRNNKILVHVYVDGPVDIGTKVGEYTANLVGSGDLSGNFFSFTLPPEFRNADQHRLYIYGKTAVAANLLQGMPYTYISYTQSTEGMDYFNNTVRPAFVTNCGSCHSAYTGAATGYESAFSALTTPAPALTGTEMNNTLVRKMSGTISHSGGDRCSGINNGPCALVQRWWTIEFGN